MKNYVYLAGPIEDCSKKQMEEWRHEVADWLELASIKVLDPTRRITFHENILNETATMQEIGQSTHTINTCRRIFKQDLQDVANSSVVLADIRRSSGRGTGTAFELMFAHMKNKIIICWADKDDLIHPFYESVYTEKHFDLESTIEAVKYYYN